MVTQNVEVVRLDSGIRYTTAEHLAATLAAICGSTIPPISSIPRLDEIDEEGNPSLGLPRIINTIGLFGGTDVLGAVLVNAVTGETAYYEVGSHPHLGGSRITRSHHQPV